LQLLLGKLRSQSAHPFIRLFFRPLDHRVDGAFSMLASLRRKNPICCIGKMDARRHRACASRYRKIEGRSAEANSPLLGLPEEAE
jgi:hypothetical protein